MQPEKLSSFLNSKMLSRHFKDRESEIYQKQILKLICPKLLLKEEEKPKPDIHQVKKAVNQ